jgi:hypothetical protein
VIDTVGERSLVAPDEPAGDTLRIEQTTTLGRSSGALRHTGREDGRPEVGL